MAGVPQDFLHAPAIIDDGNDAPQTVKLGNYDLEARSQKAFTSRAAGFPSPAERRRKAGVESASIPP
jgi:hypothetical protein